MPNLHRVYIQRRRDLYWVPSRDSDGQETNHEKGETMTQPFTTAELDAIRAKAEAATPGPWFAKDSIRNKSEYLAPGELEPTFDNDENTFGWSITVADPSEGYSIVHGENYHSIEDIQKDIDFIATANPATVLRLVEQIKRFHMDHYLCDAKSARGPILKGGAS